MNHLISLKEKYDAASGQFAQTHSEYQKRSRVLQEQIDELTSTFNAENAVLLAQMEAEREEVFTAERALRSAMEDEWVAEVEAAKAENRKPSKQFAPGLSVRITSRLVYSEGDALAWARTAAPFLVRETVDKKQFETAIKSLDLPFVTIEEKVSTVIS